MTGTGLRGYTATTTMHASERTVVGLSCQPPPWPKKHDSRRILLHACCHGRLWGTVGKDGYSCSSPLIQYSFQDRLARMVGSKFSGRLLFFTSVPLPEASDGLPMGITRLNRLGPFRVAGDI